MSRVVELNAKDDPRSLWLAEDEVELLGADECTVPSGPGIPRAIDHVCQANAHCNGEAVRNGIVQ